MVSIQVIFQPHISQNIAKSMPSLTSQLCGNSMPAVRQDGSIYRPPRHSRMLDRLTGLKYVLVLSWTMAKKGSNKVPIPGVNDK